MLKVLPLMSWHNALAEVNPVYEVLLMVSGLGLSSLARTP
jgi:hypothetical protein